MSGALAPFSQGCVVLVELDHSKSIRGMLENRGYEVAVCETDEECLAILRQSVPSVVCLDIGVPNEHHAALIIDVHAIHPSLPILVLTPDSNVELVVHAMRAGAYDYMVKPINENKLMISMRNACEQQTMSTRLSQLAREKRGEHYRGILGGSEVMKDLFRQLDLVAAVEVTVLIHGESGTGKELVARALHDQSKRSAQPFVAVNCAAIPESLHESELFGHEKGAFTGATQRQIGKFEQADGGTLFLDEVGELSAALQAKLLRALQERRFHRVGGTQEIQVDIRLIAATHRDLAADMQSGKFREDLFFRLAVYELELPPLRDRGADILNLARHFVGKYATEMGRPLRLSPASEQLLARYSWPGNVRELQNSLHRACVSANQGVIEPAHFPPRLVRPPSSPSIRTEDVVMPPFALGTNTPYEPGEAANDSELPVGTVGEEDPAERKSLDNLERSAIIASLAKHSMNLTRAAKELGIGRTTLYRKMKRYGL